ncbi:hypothetical protein BHE74_00025950 [Ensete ventricosum]|uniref:Uncharacterized protein n=1 Tax=Ensete ventricosum TaxID=4639 RepID=A0A426Y1Q0_ENSVE|nr:hypothetical protein B296_00048796 [Ensete ventricosum]RWW25588.1 hypothetical protein GW17_00010060 [Ensete ventricosum]RWW66666.1 hypothetical protein BHE74_00025950 [Ensete ventricosum]RZS02478.1 hypothetical protein BHM03_00032531 [Ensete ventricosum]
MVFACILQRLGILQPPSGNGWVGPQGSSSGLVVKRTLRVDIPVDQYPNDESVDFFKKQQLRELAMLNGTLRDEGSHTSGSASPFHNSLGLKRAKTRG